MLRRGGPRNRRRASEKTENPRALSPDELHELGQIAVEWRCLLLRSKDFVTRLRRARGLPARAVVESRLLCVLQDSLAPGVQDLGAIEEEARKPDGEKK